MDHLWTPWRMPYLSGQEPLPEGCIFCIKPQEQDSKVHILHRGSSCYVILNRYPYNNGHLMIVPFAHVPSPVEMDAETLAEWMALTQLSLRVLQRAYDLGREVGLRYVYVGNLPGARLEDTFCHNCGETVLERWGFQVKRRNIPKKWVDRAIFLKGLFKDVTQDRRASAYFTLHHQHDISNAADELGWKPRPYAEGIREVAQGDWWREEPAD